MKWILKPYLNLYDFNESLSIVPIKQFPILSGLPVVEIVGTEHDVELANTQLQRAHGMNWYTSIPMPTYTWIAEQVDESV